MEMVVLIISKTRGDRITILEWENENTEITTAGGNIVCSPDFIRKTYSVVFEFLHNITERVKEDYPQPKNL